MASILRVNTLTDASSNNSTPMATVNQGTAKFWINFNATGTVAITDSFNVASLTDIGTGNQSIGFSTNFANTTYARPSQVGNSASGRYGGINDQDGNTTSACAYFGFQTSTGSDLDAPEYSSAGFGDSA
jgi:hypothetical protein